jgi:ABC-type molybdate transport system substrate-binding protein
MKLTVILAFAFLAVPISSHAQEITVAAAADLRPAMDEMISRFQGGQGQSGIHVNIKAIYGSSGNFFEQIRSGAPFDLFFSANTDYPKKLETAGLIVAGTYYEYARGKIVLLVTANSNLDVKRGLSLLLDPEVKKIAIADPSHAPYGQAAVVAMKHENIYGIGKTINCGKYFAGLVLCFRVRRMWGSRLSPCDIDSRFKPVSPRFRQVSPVSRRAWFKNSSKNHDLASKFNPMSVATRPRVLERHGFEVPAKR